MQKEKAMPAKMPVTMDAAPNIPAVEAYSGSTDLGGGRGRVEGVWQTSLARQW